MTVNYFLWYKAPFHQSRTLLRKQSHHCQNPQSWDVLMNGCKWKWCVCWWWQKLLDEFSSVQGFTFCSVSAKCCKINLTEFHSTMVMTQSILQWQHRSFSTQRNWIFFHDQVSDLMSCQRIWCFSVWVYTKYFCIDCIFLNCQIVIRA